jgi:nucleotide-binding universal stress UspA family protein
MTGMTQPIVVGLDGSWPSRGALRWALREAGMRRRPLRIVGVETDPERLGPTRTAIGDAVVEVRRYAPGLPIEGVVRTGSPAAVLCAESAHAALVVLASRGSGGRAAPALGSVADQVARHADSPVMVVQNGEAWAPIGASLTSARPVMVGIDDSPESYLAVGFAFEEAQARGVAVVAVRGWSPTDPPPAAAPPDPAAAQRRLVDEAVTGWQAKYPYVPVRHRVVPAEPVAALLAGARDADLVVVGSRGAGSAGRDGPRQLLGSVGRRLLHHAPCAVVVVHRRTGPLLIDAG